MKTDYLQTIKNIKGLADMLPSICDMLEVVEKIPSGNHSELNQKMKLICAVVDLKDEIYSQIELMKKTLEEKQNKYYFMKEQEGLAVNYD
jgi:hypothetical protein